MNRTRFVVGGLLAVTMTVAGLWIFDLGPFRRLTAVYYGRGFAFEYPVEWPVISGFRVHGIHGPNIMGAVGTGDFDAGCVETPSSTTCTGPKWSVPANAVVLVYWIDSHLAVVKQPDPAMQAGDEWVFVAGRRALLSRTATSRKWHFPGAPEFIEARWGAQRSDTAPAEIDAIIASWGWQGE